MLLMYDGFDNYGTWANALLRSTPQQYSQGAVGPSISTSDPRFSGNPYLGLGTAASCNFFVENTDPTFIFGTAIEFTSVLGSVDITLRDVSVAPIVNNINIRFNMAGGVITATRGNAGGTLLGTTGTGGFIRNGWQFLEIKVVIHATLGSVEVRLRGQPVLTLTGINTQGGSNDYCNSVVITSSTTDSTLGQASFDDIYLLNGIADTGVYTFDDFLGDCRVFTLTPNGDYAVQWTRLSGASNYLMVNATAFNGGSTYNYSSTVTDEDMFDLANLPSGVVSVYAVQLVGAFRQDDAAGRSIQQLLDSGGTPDAGPVQALSTNYGFYGSIFTQDPNVAGPWTSTSVNDLRVGYTLAV